MRFQGWMLLLACCASLAGCGGDSSTHVVVKVDNSIDDKDSDPNLVVVVRVDDQDDARSSGQAGAQTGLLQGSVREDPSVPLPGAAGSEPVLAYVALDAEGRPAGLALADPGGATVASIASSALTARSDIAWSPGGERLVFSGTGGLYLTRRGTAGWTPPTRLPAPPGASAVDWGPTLEIEQDGQVRRLDVLIAVAPAPPTQAEDVFALYLDERGALAGEQNLTGSPALRELDASWAHGGTQLAVLERGDADAIVLRDVSFRGRRAPERVVEAALDSTGRTLWRASAGEIRDVRADHTGGRLAISAWNGRDWDALCVDARGGTRNLGRSGIDETAPSWSADDTQLAVEQRCSASGCGALPALVLALDGPSGAPGCPGIASLRELSAPGAGPAWLP
jgi:hypothetical protein